MQSRPTRWSGLMVLVCLALGSLAARAQQVAPEALPAPESLIERHLEACGGKAALEKITDRVSTGTVLIKPMGITGKVVNCQARPDRFYTRLELDKLGMVERGGDGKVCWEKTAQPGLRIMPDDERMLMNVLMSMDLTEYASMFGAMRTTGAVMAAGEACFEAALTPRGSERPILFDFSKATGLIVRIVTTIPSKDGDITVENLPEAYAKIGDVLVAHQSVEKALGVETRLTLTTIQQNVKLDKSIFRQPDATSADMHDKKK